LYFGLAELESVVDERRQRQLLDTLRDHPRTEASSRPEALDDATMREEEWLLPHRWVLRAALRGGIPSQLFQCQPSEAGCVCVSVECARA
jgi:hypothetical protein